MSARVTLALAAFCLSSPCVLAEGPRLQYHAKMHDVTDSPRRLIAERGGFRMYSVPSALRVTPGTVTAGRGRGGDVAALTTTQVAYSHPESGNAVLLEWDETTVNSSGVNVFVNDFLIGPVPGLSEPGINTVFLDGFPDGLFTLKVESIDDGSVAEATQMLLDTQPLADAENIVCGPGAEGSVGSCDLDVDWENPGPAPDVYVIILNGEPLGTIPGDTNAITLENSPPGDYTVELVGFSSAENNQGEYRGRFVETSCHLECSVAAPIETPAVEDLGLLALLAVLLALGCRLLRRRTPALLHRQG